MTVKTVGELKKTLENFDDNTPLDLYACCYDRDNYTCIQRNKYQLEQKAMEIEISLYNGFLRIKNEKSDDMELSY